MDSSIWVEPYFVRVLFTSMLAVKDVDFVVRGNAFQLAKRFNMTEREVLDGLKILSSPDKKRLEPQPYEGRRIEKVEDGWLILNAEKYREMIKRYKNQRRNEYMREWMRRKRKKPAKNVPSLAERNHERDAHGQEG